MVVGREGRGLAEGHDELDDLEGLGVDGAVRGHGRAAGYQGGSRDDGHQGAACLAAALLVTAVALDDFLG